jgi:hypothetical protein
MSNWTIEEDLLLQVVSALRADLASMRQCFDAADRERSGLRDRAERAEAERDALRADARRYLWHKARNPSGLLTTAWAASKAACEIGDDPDAATDVAMRDDSVTAPPIWETLAAIGESAPAGTWDALPAENWTDWEARELWVLLQLRVALGDPTGELMQDELVERARDAWADAQLYRMLRAAEKKE